MKRLFSVLLAVVFLLLSILCVSGLTQYKADTGKTVVTIDDWVYEAIEGGKYWELDQYLGEETDIIIPRIVNDKMVVSIGNHCFNNNTTVKTVSTSSPLWTVSEYAFLNCTSLESFECSFALKEIEVGAFYGTSSLRSINLENSVVTVIRPHVFTNSGIVEAQIPETCTEIMHDAFSQCQNLEKLIIPRSVVTIDDKAFTGSDSLTIYCYTDSAAHQFAVAKNIPFVLLDAGESTEPSTETIVYMLGDADGDGIITISDATVIQRVLAHIIDDEDGMITLRGDVNEDGLDIGDVTKIQFYLAHLYVAEPIGTEVTKHI